MTISTSDGVSLVPEGYVANTTLASLPSASGYPVGTKAFASNVGLNGTEMVVSSSGTWIPNGGTCVYSSTDLPLLLACTIPADASASANGAITFGTALNVRIDNAFVYFEANVVNGTQPAGFYFTKFSTTTAAVVYNNTYTPANGTRQKEPATLVPFAGAVPGGAGTTSEITAFISTLVGGVLGKWGSLNFNTDTQHTTTAGTKSIIFKLDSTSATSTGNATTGYGESVLNYIKNVGSESVQHGRTTSIQTPTSSFGSRTAIDTSIDKPISITMQKNTATDWMAIIRSEIMLRVS